ncbi:MAG: ribonuclease P protein component 4 [Candidatus Micrarchaeia archaeon]
MSKRKISKKKKESMQSIAEERIRILLDKAFEAMKEGNEGFARRYCALARKIQLRYRVRLKKEIALKYCKKCYLPWIIGKTLKVRTNSKDRCIEYICICGYKKRYRY